MVASYIGPAFYKTTADIQMIFDMMKAHKQEVLGKDKMFHKIQKNSPSYRFLIKPLKYIPDFSVKLTKEDIGSRIPTYFPNPEKHWGPKTKAVSVKHKGKDKKKKK